MRRPEQLLWDAMRRNLGKSLNMTRIENAVEAGRPDVEIALTGTQLPVELKAVRDWPKRVGTRVLGPARGLSVAQRNWFLERRKLKGECVILVGVGLGSEREVFLFSGADHDHINGFNSHQFRAAALAVGWHFIHKEILEIERKGTT